MKADWETFINFSEDIFIPINFFSESTEKQPIELPIEPLIELQLSYTDNLNTTSYQYKLCIDDNFND
ncbi:hypothetical protein RhiirA4_476465 [Rhizophagus irregularis]|uniref:Uncharacterized protein n=1 Tax=Rhizophagus irregularis TaxID=588596 RepID=A0A2I1HBL2_9GLOM|nr:hypothetical protein RhiirA4_476465 [Rhizophagus irregularis]